MNRPTVPFLPHTKCPHCGHDTSACPNCGQKIRYDEKAKRNIFDCEFCCACGGEFYVDYKALAALA